MNDWKGTLEYAMTSHSHGAYQFHSFQNHSSSEKLHPFIKQFLPKMSILWLLESPGNVVLR